MTTSRYGSICTTCWGAGRVSERREETIQRFAREKGHGKERGPAEGNGEEIQVKRWWSVPCPQCKGAEAGRLAV